MQKRREEGQVSISSRNVEKWNTEGFLGVANFAKRLGALVSSTSKIFPSKKKDETPNFAKEGSKC